MSHSPEPWKAVPIPYCDPDDPAYSLADSHNQDISGRHTSADKENDGVWRGFTKEDADRITACVNACRGIPTHVLRHPSFSVILTTMVQHEANADRQSAQTTGGILAGLIVRNWDAPTDPSYTKAQQ